MFSKVFSKKTLVGKVHFQRDFLDALRGTLELDADLSYHIAVNPFVGRALANLPHGLGKVFRGDAELLAIPTHPSLMLEVLFQ